jgi:hypothetical protein
METKETTQHTPTPWAMYYPPANQLDEFANHFSITQPLRRTVISRVPINNDNLQEAEANAAFIVKACNNHNKLKVALTALLQFAQQYGPSSRARSEHWSGFFEVANRALNEAK